MEGREAGGVTRIERDVNREHYSWDEPSDTELWAGILSAAEDLFRAMRKDSDG